jgi:hypothetical protein
MSRKAAPDCAPLHPGYEKTAVVGYGRPPLHTQFPKGRSGNPRGRPKGSKNVAAILLDSAHEFVTVKEAGHRKSITKLEAMGKQIANKAASGDPRASQLLVQMLQTCEGRSAKPAPAAVIDEADELVIQQLFVRVREMTAPASSSTAKAGEGDRPEGAVEGAPAMPLATEVQCR